ncbi:hypothetical protein SLEP1_g49316 [Rubroshorea leprosula]|uniref:SAM domain-containing protein n=1 Tax=Rubroshorea leprosula TaxID=152421 RepID=A0AAV5LXD9_9ROSI|nr:hypothetical protein SLEP1_g49316 [Rubroshorea leprosula]
MVKSKQTQLAAKPASKKNTKSGIRNTSTANIEVDLQGEDSWIIVKKQRVTILVPPLPVAKTSKATNLGPSQLQAMPKETVENQSKPADQTCPNLPSVNEREEFPSSASKKVIESARRSPVQPFSKIAKSQRLDCRTGSQYPNQVCTLKSQKIHGVSETSKTIEKLRLLHGPRGPIAGNMLLNWKLRVSNLERKLQQVGGLSRWLTSLGLGQFVRIFQAQNVNKFQLVNLTMKKLKEMGADAVGPRRKLIHAIDCVCQLF